MKWLNGIIDKVKKSLAVKCNIHWIKKHKKELRENMVANLLLYIIKKLLPQKPTIVIFQWRSVPYKVQCGMKCLI